MYYIIKQITRVAGKRTELYFQNITRREGAHRGFTNTFIEHWDNNRDKAVKFFDKEEAQRFADMVEKSNPVSSGTTVIKY